MAAIQRSRIPLLRQFRFRLEFPEVAPEFRSLRFVILLPGLYIEYLENAPSWCSPYRVESGCRIGVYNPLGDYGMGQQIPLLPSFEHTVRTRYARSYLDRRWVEVPDGWSGGWTRTVQGEELDEPVI